MKNQSGYTLIEFSLTIAIVLATTAILTGVAAYLRDRAKTESYRMHVVSVRSAASKLTANGLGVTPPDHPAIARAGNIPNDQLVPVGIVAPLSTAGLAAERAADLADAGPGNVLRSPFGGFTGVRFAEDPLANGGRLVSILTYDLSGDDCIRAIHSAWDAFDVIQVSGGAPLRNRFASPPLVQIDPAAIEAACSTGDTLRVDLSFAP